MFLEHEYRKLAVVDNLANFQAKEDETTTVTATAQTSQAGAALLLPAVTASNNLLPMAVAPTCTPPSQGYRPGVAGKSAQKISIFERNWRTPKERSAKRGQIATQWRGNGEDVEKATAWIRFVWLMGVLMGFAGLMLAL